MSVTFDRFDVFLPTLCGCLRRRLVSRFAFDERLQRLLAVDRVAPTSAIFFSSTALVSTYLGS